MPDNIEHKPRPKVRAIVQLLDFRIFELTLHSRLSAQDVLRMIAEQLDIHSLWDSRYFGLSTTDESGDPQWIDSSVILIDLALSLQNFNGVLMLSHRVKFFNDNICEIQSVSTAKFYFIEAHNQLMHHELLVNSDTYFELVAILLTVYAADCRKDTLNALLCRMMPNDHPPYVLIKNTRTEIERKIYEIFTSQQKRHLRQGTAIMKFIKLAEKSESYGYRMYELMDDDDEKCMVSIGGQGIFVYRRSKLENLVTLYMGFPWRVIDNLYFRDKIFSIEIRHSKLNETRKSYDSLVEDTTLENDRKLSEACNHPTTQFSTLRRREIATNSRVLMFNFTCQTCISCRSIWSSAIAQHRFFLEQKTIRKKSHQRNQVIDHNELTEKLNRLTSTSSPSLTSTSTLGMPAAKIGDTSTSSLPTTTTTSMSSKPAPTSKSLNSSTSSFYKISPEDFKKDVQRYNALRTKKSELERKLLEKMKELKEVCIEEGDITGELPDEIHTAVLPGDEFPRLKKRVGTAYSIPDELIKADKADKMGQLETDVELHRRIVAAASRLATDKNTNKSVRKKRQKDLQAARQRLTRLEQGLQQMRHSASKPDISSIASDASINSWNASSHSAPMTIAMTKSCPTTPRGSIPDLRRHHQDLLDDDKSEIEDHSIEERVSRRAPSALSRHSLQQRYSGISSSSTSSGSDSIGGLPPRPKPSSVHTQTPLDHSICMEMTSPLYENVGYRSTSYRSSYRQAHYPTIQDEHTQQNQRDRKRAQSAHQIISDDQNGRTCTYSVPLNDAQQKFIDVDFDDDMTPTNDFPRSVMNHRLTTSISCQAGFATASLDRRKSNVQRIPMNGSSDDMIRQSVTTRITTFPVAQPQNTLILAGGKPYSTSELPRFPHPPPVARVTHLPRGSLPPYSGSPSGGIPKTNPQMEALLSYYKQQTNGTTTTTKSRTNAPAAPKTATIV